MLQNTYIINRLIWLIRLIFFANRFCTMIGQSLRESFLMTDVICLSIFQIEINRFFYVFRVTITIRYTESTMF